MASCACGDDAHALGALLERAAREHAAGEPAAHLLVQSARCFIDRVDDLDWAESLLNAALDRHPHSLEARELLDDVLVSLAKKARQAGDLERCERHLARLVTLRGGDTGIEEALARLVLARVRSGDQVAEDSRRRAAERFVAVSVGRDDHTQLELCQLALELDPGNEDALIRVLARSQAPDPDLTPLLAQCLGALPSNGNASAVEPEEAPRESAVPEQVTAEQDTQALATTTRNIGVELGAMLGELATTAQKVLGTPEALDWLASIAGPRLKTTLRDLASDLERNTERARPPESGLRPPPPPSHRYRRPADRTGA